MSTTHSTTRPAEPSMRLDGHVAVVTGAAQGIGEVTAERLAALGAKVALLDVKLDAAEAAAERIRAAGGEAIAVACDVGDRAQVEAAAATVDEQFGPASVLVNNAGVISWTPLEELSLEEWDRIVLVNQTGVFHCTQVFGRQMLAQERGSIIHIGSVAAVSPEARAGAYSASKAAVRSFADQVAVEWGPRGIRSNTVSPGMLRTAMAEAFYSVPEALASREQMTAQRRIGVPAECADVIAFLASDAASYVTGQEIQVDGGLMAMLTSLIPRPGVNDAD